MIDITDPDDPRVAAFRDVRERDLVGREGGFIAETALIVGRLLEPTSRHGCAAVLMSESQANAKPGLVDAAEARGVPVYRAAQEVMDTVAGFPVHRGVLAYGRRAPDLRPDAIMQNPPGRCAAVALIGVSNHDNVGSAFRNAAAFGALGVLLDPTTSDPLYRKAIRVSGGAVLSLPFAKATSADALLDAAERAGFTPLALSPAGEHVLHTLTPPARALLVLGAEGPGLPDAVLARCRTVRIAMAPGADSVNVAAAGALALHHVFTRDG